MFRGPNFRKFSTNYYGKFWNWYNKKREGNQMIKIHFGVTIVTNQCIHVNLARNPGVVGQVVEQETCHKIWTSALSCYN